MLWLLIYGIFMVNKTSPGGRGGAKKIKKVSIFSKKGFLRGGPKNFFLRAYAQIAPPPNQKPSYAPESRECS